MSTVKEALSVLKALQEKDCALDALKQKAAGFPGMISQRKQAFEDLRRQAEEKKQGLTQLQMEKKNKEIELQTHEADIRKHNLELNAIKSNDAYKALLNEIAEGKKAVSDIETGILDLMERIEEAVKASKSIDQEVKQKEQEMQAEVRRLEEEQKNALAEVAAAEQDRVVAVAKVPEAIIRQYDHIREVRDGVAVAPVEGETCGGCNMLLRPALINEVFKAADFVCCDSCSRILYRKEEAGEKKS